MVLLNSFAMYNFDKRLLNFDGCCCCFSVGGKGGWSVESGRDGREDNSSKEAILQQLFLELQVPSDFVSVVNIHN